MLNVENEVVMRKIRFFSVFLVLIVFYGVSAQEKPDVVQETQKQEKEVNVGEKIYEGMAVSQKMSEDVLKKITVKYSKMYKKYAGVKSTRHLTVKWYKPKTNKLVKTEKVVYKRWDDWYEDLKYKTISYFVDGEKDDPEDYDPHESAPGIPHFDENGAKEYVRKVVAVEKLDGRLVYKVEAIPRDPKGEHFKGFIWVSIDGLEIMKNEGTSGKMRFGCSSLYVTYRWKDFGDYFHFTKGYTKVTLNVLGLYKRIMVFEFENKDIEPMPLPRKKK